MAYVLEDTIVAPATPPGSGAIAIVRMSGSQARSIAAQLAPSRYSRRSHQLSQAVFRNAQGDVLDEGMVVEMHAPRSYTGEDVVELHVHGSRAVVQAALQACQDGGARLARPGEFTLRAFLNGRMDLLQAEAVGDLIASTYEAQRRAAAAQLRGGLSQPVEHMLETLEGVMAQWQAALDFPDYPTGDGFKPEHATLLDSVQEQMRRLSAQAQTRIQQGWHVTLCGAPNAGKSTLLNAWAGEVRVLVDAAPGTTRDPVEVALDEGLQRWWVCDTAGIREDTQGLEARGIELSFQRAQQSDAVLWLISPDALDADRWPPENLTVTWMAGSKADRWEPSQRRCLEDQMAARHLPFLGWVSAHTGEGVEALRQAVTSYLNKGTTADVALGLVKERHVQSLREATLALQTIQQGLEQGQPLDILAMDLKEAMVRLGDMLGRHVDEDVLNRIFSEFCIGK